MTQTTNETKYYVDHNGWTWMPVEDILVQTESSIDFGWQFDWETVITDKAADEGFGYLVESIMAHGWKSAIGWTEGRITEGHHRLVAAILLCEDMVPVTNYGTDWRGDDYEEIVSAHGDQYQHSDYPVYVSF